jgi:hypothetical protein
MPSGTAGRDVDNYEAACRELAHLEGLREVFNTRQALLAKLELVAPAWARAITQRHKPHDASQPPGEPASAWRWRQWLQELSTDVTAETFPLDRAPPSITIPDLVLVKR